MANDSPLESYDIDEAKNKTNKDDDVIVCGGSYKYKENNVMV